MSQIIIYDDAPEGSLEGTEHHSKGERVNLRYGLDRRPRSHGGISHFPGLKGGRGGNLLATFQQATFGVGLELCGRWGGEAKNNTRFAFT